MSQLSIKGRFARNVGWSVISELLIKGLIFAVNIYLARVLDASGFGMLSLGQSIALYFWIAVDLGTAMYGIREVSRARERANELINLLMTIRIAAGLVIFLLYAVSLLLIVKSGPQRAVYIASGLFLFTFSLNMEWASRGLERFDAIAAGNLASGLVYLAGVGLVVRSVEDAALAAFLWAVSYVAGAAVLYAWLRRRTSFRLSLDFRFNLWGRHLRESVLFTLTGVLAIVYQNLPVVAIGYFMNHAEVGLYSASNRLVQLFTQAGSLMAMAIYPILSDLYARDPALFSASRKKYQYLMLGLGLPVAVLGYFLSEEVVLLIYGRGYSESVAITKALVWWVPLFFFRTTYGIALMASGRQRLQNLSLGLGTFAAIAICVGLIPRLGAMGAAYALIGAEVVMISSSAWFYKAGAQN